MHNTHCNSTFSTYDNLVDGSKKLRDHTLGYGEYHVTTTQQPAVLDHASPLSAISGHVLYDSGSGGANTRLSDQWSPDSSLLYWSFAMNTEPHRTHKRDGGYQLDTGQSTRDGRKHLEMDKMYQAEPLRDISSRLSIPVAKANSPVFSRRKPVPGENIPFLAASGRQTTTSTGADNHWRSRKKSKANFGTESPRYQRVTRSPHGSPLASTLTHKLWVDSDDYPGSNPMSTNLVENPTAAILSLGLPRDLSTSSPILGSIGADTSDLTGSLTPVGNDSKDLTAESSDSYDYVTSRFRTDTYDTSWIPPSTDYQSMSMFNHSTDYSITVPEYISSLPRLWDSTGVGTEYQNFSLNDMSHTSQGTPLSACISDNLYIPSIDGEPLSMTSAQQARNEFSYLNGHSCYNLAIDHEQGSQLSGMAMNTYSCDLRQENQIVLGDTETDFQDHLVPESVSPLTTAASRGKVDMVRLLLKNGANVNQIHSSSYPVSRFSSALHAAAYEGHPEVVRLLLEFGADVDINASSAPSPLQVAISRDHFNIVELLLEAGADANGNKTSTLSSEKAVLDEGIVAATTNYKQLSRVNSGSNRITKGKPPTRNRKAQQISTKFSTIKGVSDQSLPLIIVSENTNETQPELQSILNQANDVSSKSLSSSGSPPDKIPIAWEHHLLVHKDVGKAISSESSQEIPRRGGRRGPLDIERRSKAKLTRQMRACWTCSLSKVSCEPTAAGSPCGQCSGIMASSSLTNRLCNREPLSNLAIFFLPLPTTHMFEEEAVESVLKSQVSGFAPVPLKKMIHVSTGLDYPSIVIPAREFVPVDIHSMTSLSYKKIKKGDNSHLTVFETTHSPPIGIDSRDMASSDIETALRAHVSQISSMKRNIGEVTYGKVTLLEADLYQAVQQYSSVNPEVKLLSDCLELFTMQYIMNLAIFVRDDPEEILESFQRPMHFPYSGKIVAQLINRQLKQVLLRMIRTMYQDVLERLEKEVRRRSKASWGTCFCSLLILHMCATMVQNSTDLRLTSASDEGREPATRDKSIEIARLLEDLAINHVVEIFHGFYKTHKVQVVTKKDVGFNPVRDGIVLEDAASFGPGTVDLMNRVRTIIQDHWKEVEKEIDPPPPSNNDRLQDHNAFRTWNLGRLARQFIQSFKPR